ncbi:MAG: sodium:solute symporter family protein [Alphaproteobacteria bacterium]|nr:sodium:solute symporter family protein [Alphaproteobacteria bacterium]
MDLGIIFWIITAAVAVIFFYISYKVKDNASSSFSAYSIGGGTFPMFLIFFTQFATIMGAGNFIGHAGNGYKIGISQLIFIAGEQGSKILFALVFAGMAGQFTYNSMPEMIDDLITRDKITRAMVGVLAASIMLAWVGGQGKALGSVFETFTGANSTLIIIIFSAIFIIYTVTGGIYSVVWTDLFQGIVCLIFGAAFYIFAFKQVDFSFAVLGEKLASVGKAEMLTFHGFTGLQLLNKFVTGVLGILVAQIYWQRCFATKDGKSSRNGLLYSGLISIAMTMGTAIVGLIIMTMNQELDANSAMPWFMMNICPPIIAIGIFMLILCAAMSSADSNLNSAAVLIVNDLIRPFFPEKTDKQLVQYAKIATVGVGIFSCAAAIYASSIIALFSRAYSMAGSGLVPVLIIGLVWKERSGERAEMGKKNSKVTPWGARLGILSGAILSQISSIPNATLVALAVSCVCVVVISMMTRNVKMNPKYVSEGNMHPILK